MSVPDGSSALCEEGRGQVMTQEPNFAARSRFRLVRKVVVTVVGFGVLAFGVAFIILPLPGSGILVIPFGLAILATEFRWARKLLDPIRKVIRCLKAHTHRRLDKASRPTKLPPLASRKGGEAGR